MITLIATLKAKPGKEQLLYEECANIVKLVRTNEPGCLMYEPHISVEDNKEIIFVEKYEDQVAFDLHTTTTYFKAFAAKFDQLLAEPLHLKFLKELE